MKIESKTFIVTGASEGIGAEVSLALAEEKANLILVSRNIERLDSVKQRAIEKGSSNVDTYSCDLRNIDEIKKTVNNIKEKHKKVDGLINNAGIWQKVNQLDNISDEEILSVLQTNLNGLIILTKYILPELKKPTEAILINIASRSGYSAQSGQSVYTASKYGVRGFTEVLREDLKDTKVKVAGVYQGGTNTKMFEKAGENWPKERYASFIPAKELAKVILFMISRPEYIWLPEVRVESK